MRLSIVHEESHRDELDIGGSSADDDHGSLLAARAARKIDAGEFKQQVFG